MVERPGSDFRDQLEVAERDGGGWEGAFSALRLSEGTGRPLGAADFVADLERLLGRPMARRAPGRKPSPRTTDQPPLRRRGE